MTERKVIAVLSVDDEKTIAADRGTLDYLEHEMLELCGVTMAEGFIADFDDTSEWQRYLNYLADWVFSHISEEFAGMSPVCFDEWRCNEEQEENQND